MKMKFGKLLAAGKSWAGGNGVGRYQMRDGFHLPKFISPKNPFKLEAVAQPIAPPTVAAAPATIVAEPEAPIAPQEQIQPVVAIKIDWRGYARKAGRIMMVWAKAAAAWGKRAAKWTREFVTRGMLFCLDHNPFSAIGKPKLPGIPRFGKSAVQGELSLDRVKVVRNDLMDADLEVVRVGAGPK
jgi:hypothetical protein